MDAVLRNDYIKNTVVIVDEIGPQQMAEMTTRDSILHSDPMELQ
jgi:hypothetical protein